MPVLSLDTSPRAEDHRADSPHSPSHSRSSPEPERPPYSPITPVLGPARLATSTNPLQNGQPQRQTYTHSQPHQTTISQPFPEPIAFDSNPDVLALKSAISILQLQARNATADVQSLQKIKERALQDPESFAKAVAAGNVKAKSDDLFAPSLDDDEEEDDDGGEAQQVQTAKADKNVWPKMPAPQNVVRTPPINWNQYAVVGDSLDKLHVDQVIRPSEGVPQRMGPDGQLSFGGDSQRRDLYLGVAAPYQPGKDKMERMGTRKGGKR